MRILPFLTGLLLAQTVLVGTVSAQTERHWSEQYGNRSMLLNGTVIAGVSDLGAVFYNPARLAQLEGRGFILSAKAYERKDVVVEDGLGEGLDLKQSNFGGSPSLVAANFRVPGLEGHTFAYAFLTRRQDDMDFSLETQATGDFVETFPGEEFYSGTAEIRSRGEEEWIGISWAHPMNDRVSFGLSTFATFLDRKSELQLDLRAISEENDVAVLLRTRRFSYSTTGLIWKGGMAVDLSPVRLGFTVTTPRLHLMGDGSTRYEDLLAGTDSTGDGRDDDAFIYDRQRDLSAEARSPWALGAGVSWEGERMVAHLSAEWYSAVAEYTMMESGVFMDSVTDEPLQYQVIDELRSVLNVGAGLEWKATDSFSAYGSVASDKSAAPAEISRFIGQSQTVSNSTSQGDMLLLGLGISLVSSWIDLTTGVTYGSIQEDLRRPINFTPRPDGPLFPEEENARYTAKRWRFLLGISIPFADNLSGRLGGDKSKKSSGG